jgi:hypothetical protein
LAQLDYPTPASGMPAWPATFACHALLKFAQSANAPAADLLRALAVTAGVVYNTSTAPLACFDVAAEFAPCSDASGCGGPRANDPSVSAWDYQVCLFSKQFLINFFKSGVHRDYTQHRQRRQFVSARAVDARRSDAVLSECLGRHTARSRSTDAHTLV